MNQTTETAKTLGEVIASIRNRNGLTRYRLAKNAGISQTTLDALEAGADARISTLIRVFAALGREGKAAWLALLDTPNGE